jgi:hypothetical protein
MVIPIILGLIYTSTLVLNFIKKDWPPIIKKYLVIGHVIFAGLIIIDIVLLSTTGSTFRGIYFDRLIIWGLLITGGLFFALFKGKGLLAKIYFGAYLFYPVVAMATFLIDRIMFVLIASPILVSVMVPETYYNDKKFEIRSSIGLMASRKIVLVEKKLVTEKAIGEMEYSQGEITAIEILGSTSDSVNARLSLGQHTELVKFKINR